MKQVDVMKMNQTIAEFDKSLFYVTDSIEDAIELIKQKSIARYGLHAQKRIRPASIFGEKNHLPESTKVG
jgi:hypothetical protein